MAVGSIEDELRARGFGRYADILSAIQASRLSGESIDPAAPIRGVKDSYVWNMLARLQDAVAFNPYSNTASQQALSQVSGPPAEYQNIANRVLYGFGQDAPLIAATAPMGGSGYAIRSAVGGSAGSLAGNTIRELGGDGAEQFVGDAGADFLVSSIAMGPLAVPRVAARAIAKESAESIPESLVKLFKEYGITLDVDNAGNMFARRGHYVNYGDNAADAAMPLIEDAMLAKSLREKATTSGPTAVTKTSRAGHPYYDLVTGTVRVPDDFSLFPPAARRKTIFHEQAHHAATSLPSDLNREMSEIWDSMPDRSPLKLWLSERYFDGDWNEALSELYADESVFRDRKLLFPHFGEEFPIPIAFDEALDLIEERLGLWAKRSARRAK